MGPHTLGGGEVNHVAVALEHVDLLNRLDGLDVQLLQGLLQLLVVGAGPGGRTLHLSAGGALASDPCGSTELLEALLNVGHCGGVWKEKRRNREGRRQRFVGRESRWESGKGGFLRVVFAWL